MNRRHFLNRSTVALAGTALSFGCKTSRAPRTARGEVLNGIDVLARENFGPLKNLRIGLITNHTGHDRQRHATIDLLKNAPGVNLVALFSPEHGIRGEADEKIGDTTDQKTGLPVFSLYGERRSPTAEQLHGLDALVYDIQDIGCRFYTYPSTMGLCIEAAGKAKLKFFVLDRVNPINGVSLEGPIHRGKSSFVGFHTTPLRHGMTVGELSRMFNGEKNYGADVTVIRCEGWRREMYFDETRLAWTNPSPNMRSLPAAVLYPGIGLHETALSVGRGTDKPFELVGAPYVDDVQLARELEKFELRGVRFVPIRFTPTYSTFKDKPCAGVAFVITDREKLNAVDLGVAVALTFQRLYPRQYALNKIEHLLLHAPTIEAIKAGAPLANIKASWRDELADFARRREKFLLYQ